MTHNINHSTNGTFVNKINIGKDNTITLKSGDILSLMIDDLSGK
jgi:hypothetical protein